VKLTKVVDLLARPRGIRTSDPRFRNTWVHDYELQRVAPFCSFIIIILQRIYENGLKTRSSRLRNLTIKEISFLNLVY